jgi:NADH pyrophosphatase NudC (nudix superfamily)
MRAMCKENPNCRICLDLFPATPFDVCPTRKLAAYEDTNLTPAEVAELAQAKADGRVVAYGEWLNFVGDYSTAECSQCENIYEVSPDEKPCEDYFNAFKQFYKFCPNCGAKMDKERENNA